MPYIRRQLPNRQKLRKQYRQYENSHYNKKSDFLSDSDSDSGSDDSGKLKAGAHNPHKREHRENRFFKHGKAAEKYEIENKHRKELEDGLKQWLENKVSSTKHNILYSSPIIAYVNVSVIQRA